NDFLFLNQPTLLNGSLITILEALHQYKSYMNHTYRNEFARTLGGRTSRRGGSRQWRHTRNKRMVRKRTLHRQISSLLNRHVTWLICKVSLFAQHQGVDLTEDALRGILDIEHNTQLSQALNDAYTYIIFKKVHEGLGIIMLFFRDTMDNRQTAADGD
ncbi:unnamed protein product, partial [Owenia fusiformis]